MSKTSALSTIHMHVMWNRLISVVEEQAQALIRTAFSTSVREAGDLAAGVFDRQGRMLAQAVTGTPGHINSMAEGVVHFINKHPVDMMRPGDVFITNDPWMTSGHLHDFTVVYRGAHLCEAGRVFFAAEVQFDVPHRYNVVVVYCGRNGPEVKAFETQAD